MVNKPTTEIVLDISDKLAGVLNNNHTSLIGILAPYVIAIASVIASVILGVLSYNSAKSAQRISYEIGKQNIEALDKSRYIEIISKERAQWIEKLRNIFHDFNESVHLYSLELDRIKGFINIKPEEELELKRLKNNIQHNWAKTFLYINPSEKVTQKLDDLINNELYKILFIEKALYSRFDPKQVNEIHPEIIFIQNVILKSEWKRLKLEVEGGRELNEEEVNFIFMEVAKNQHEEFYEKLLKTELAN
ncbi:hypothetical protein NSS75_13970 [Bacillus sp. FSL K6-1012]|uniref:hypothetical protein n=1 Tax=unclassified Bacillus (in: firmicutes) TaxID=185979 RepID=UPI002281A0F7|nr:hypothetical protein [Bacillus spizizenii]MEC0617042.1 hypothetical protein [Bacillus inaquosorum]MCY7994669.1 hypothetical protein [Bacillus spizizenii]MCY8115056.1 hypothetical protein [Bacillus spizizenii]MCY8128730.1 hypothetical protein [Bacillus spizizenii]